MNLENIINKDFGLQQDQWTLTNPSFGLDSQLTVIGWSGYYRYSTSKLYVVSCSYCSMDSELYGEGVFKSKKGHLLSGKMPCGCTKTFWTEAQYATLCERKALSMGYGFVSFEEPWRGKSTRVWMVCDDHGEWLGGSTQMLLSGRLSCRSCNNAEQKQAYINLLEDNDNIIAIKFGVATDTGVRVKQQNYKSVYNIRNHSTYVFPTASACRQAETRCKQFLICGVIPKDEMLDGYTETTWAYNIDKVIEIYEDCGGILI